MAFVTIENGNLEDTRGIGECIIVDDRLGRDGSRVGCRGRSEKSTRFSTWGFRGNRWRITSRGCGRILDDADLDDEEDDVC